MRTGRRRRCRIQLTGATGGAPLAMRSGAAYAMSGVAVPVCTAASSQLAEMQLAHGASRYAAFVHTEAQLAGGCNSNSAPYLPRARLAVGGKRSHAEAQCVLAAARSAGTRALKTAATPASGNCCRRR